MSGSHRPNRRSSDFSIARILARSSRKTNELPNLNIITTRLTENRIHTPENFKFHYECNQSIDDTSTGDNRDLSRTELKLVASETVCASSSSSISSTSELIKSVNDKCELPRENNELIPSKNLSWLQCTRYRPPKLPRKSLAGKICKRKPATHPRIPFTSFQLQTLEDKYKKNAYLSRKDVVQLSTILRLPHNRIKIWFQNRRARDRRETQVTSS
ncbi:homeobox protein engrailed-2-A-like [Microplitis mediator]|uniref:homeobox protein engrailed-2-A-like n=1 Tax=Microplitis mediator TaxID=375433 RepID=UPI0025547BA1|nr:homeobox protein engrailed-2-A-like [Microplitis mediator]